MKKIVRDFSELKKILDGFNGVFSFDLETSGLNPKEDRIVGFSVGKGDDGYYVPLKHLVGQNSDISLLNLVVEYILRSRYVLMWNKNFDLNFLYYSFPNEFEIVTNVLDVMVVYYNYNSDAKSFSLKSASEELLKVKQTKFVELLGDTENIHLMYPEDVYEYACDDAIYTFKIYDYLYSFIKDNSFIIKVDNLVAEIIRYISRQEYKLDLDNLIKQEEFYLTRIRDLESKIYDFAGYNFLLESPTQVTKVLLEKGIILREKTEKGAYKTSKDVLLSLVKEYPILNLFIQYSDYSTLYNNYVKKLKNYAVEQGFVRINYFHSKVPTGRIASGLSSSEDTYFSKVNIQSISKPEIRDMVIIPDSNTEFGWSYEVYDTPPPNVSSYYEVESSLKSEIRSVFIPSSESRVIVSVDYKAQELRIAANYSQEPLWIDALKNNRDLHSQTSRLLFGSEDKNHRKIAKIVNFAILYGGSPYMLSKTLNLPYNEVEVIYNRFFEEYKVLSRWIDSIQKYARNHDVKTCYGRIRRTKRLFREAGADFKRISFCKRTAVNTLIQGTGADILRNSLIKVFKYHLEHKDKFRIMFLIHDEIVYEVERDFLKEFIYNIKELMEVRDFEVPILCDFSIGKNWGQLVPYEISNGVIKPNGTLVDF